MKIIHNDGFSYDELLSFKVIYNIIMKSTHSWECSKLDRWWSCYHQIIHNPPHHYPFLEVQADFDFQGRFIKNDNAMAPHFPKDWDCFRYWFLPNIYICRFLWSYSWNNVFHKQDPPEILLLPLYETWRVGSLVTCQVNSCPHASYPPSTRRTYQ